MKKVQVAVAVINYSDIYLLSYRNASQHQGNRYEFVGGKVEGSESEIQGLMREVREEIGLDISQYSHIEKMGVVNHEYIDDKDINNSKLVCLHVFKVVLSIQQYDDFKLKEYGCEGQKLIWVNKLDLINNKYRLPDANLTILNWLKNS